MSETGLTYEQAENVRLRQEREASTLAILETLAGVIGALERLLTSELLEVRGQVAELDARIGQIDRRLSAGDAPGQRPTW